MMKRCRYEDVAERVLDEAARLFGTLRFHEVRMDDVADQSGVSKGTLYRYFKDKEELFLALVNRASEQFTARCKAAVQYAPGARAGLVALVGAIIAFFDEQPHLLELIQRAEIRHGMDSGTVWRESRAELIHLVLDLFAEGERQGEFRLPDPEMTMLLLLGGLRAVIRFGPRPRPEGLAERAVEALVGGGMP
jgi:AcrR family transcriptional regulator